MKSSFLFGGIILSIVLFVFVFALIDMNSGEEDLEDRLELIAPRGYRRLSKAKEAYMIDLIGIPKKQTSLWRVYANSPIDMICYFYDGKQWIVPNNGTFIIMKAFAIYNAFGRKTSGVTFTLPPLSGMEETWRKNIEDFRQGKWFR